ncbi:MAG: MFS transporter [Bacteroidota bacterium]|nr:MFS transporter [Bacteroidota bacterium]
MISTAIFPIYYDAVTRTENSDQVSFLGTSFTNTVLYNYTIAGSFLVLALISPYLSAMADISGNKKRFMQVFVYLGSFSCLSLFLFDADHLWIGIMGSFVASIGFSGSLVFYNAYLPVVAPPEKQDRLSAKGFALGYAGSSILLIGNLWLIQNPGALGLSDAGSATRLSFLTVGIWWLGFSQIPFSRLPVNVFHRKVKGHLGKKAYQELFLVIRNFSNTPRLKRFITAFFFYSVGVQTIILIASLFGTKVLGLPSEALILTVLIIQFVAIAGSILFSRLSEKIGNIKSIGTAIFLWMAVCLSAFFVNEEWQFYTLGGLVGLVLGGIQALSRSTYSKMLPETMNHATYFSFYDVTEKLATMIGMFSIGFIESLTGDLRNASLALTTFFAISFIALLTIPRSRYVY